MKKFAISLLLIISMLLSSISIINTETPVYAAKKPKKTTIIETSTDGCYNGFNVTLRWKKKSKITGYQIKYSLYKNFKKSKAVKIPSKNILTTSIYNLKPNKTYYFKIRCYKKTKKKTYYSKWSSVEAVKTNKRYLNRDEDPNYVWISTDYRYTAGIKTNYLYDSYYHSISYCEYIINYFSSYDFPEGTEPHYICVTKEEAEALGYKPCECND